MTKLTAKQLSSIDHLICGFDRALRTLNSGTTKAMRETPAAYSKNKENETLSESQQKLSASLMRVNHAGEVCAQALYQGQALTAKTDHVRNELQHAANEELDHLAWCEDRLNELHSHTSVLNPLWYCLSFSLGATAGLISDNVSLGFVGETEHQVGEHLKSHLKKLPKDDAKSRAIIEQMIIEEEHHGQTAMNAGGKELPAFIKSAMRGVAKVMTSTSRHI